MFPIRTFKYIKLLQILNLKMFFIIVLNILLIFFNAKKESFLKFLVKQKLHAGMDGP